MSDATGTPAGESADADGDGGDPAAALSAAAERLREAESAVAAVGDGEGNADAEAVAEAYRAATDLLDRYEGRATGTGDFEAYVEFQEAFVDRVSALREALPRRDAFEAANETLDRRRLRERDFERAREALAPARDAADRLAERAAAREAYREARRTVERRRAALGERVDDLDRVRSLGDADLDAPVERLREPIAAYNEAAREAFAAFKEGASARETLAVAEATAAYPLVPFARPPDDLRSYVRDAPAGEEPIPTLIAYADYSPSKLDHYLDDPAAFRARVSTNRTYLERLDGEPLTVSWPPPAAGTLRYRARELVSVLGRFAPEETVARARNLRGLAAGDGREYARLRRAAAARAELTDGERERLAAGDVDAELAAVRAERGRLDEALAAHPPERERDAADRE